MSKKKKIDDIPPYIKYTEFGFPYVDVDILFSSKEGKELNERLDVIRDLPINKSGSSGKNAKIKSS